MFGLQMWLFVWNDDVDIPLEIFYILLHAKQ